MPMNYMLHTFLFTCFFLLQQINNYGYFVFPPIPLQEQQDKIWLKTIVFNLGILL
jgi:hypothetical protein